MASGRDTEIIALLRDVTRRLKKSEAERKVLLQEIVEQKKSLTAIEDKTEQGEKAFISIQSKITQRDRVSEELVARQDELDQRQKDQEQKLTKTETEQGNLKKKIENTDKKISGTVENLEKVAVENAKLSRRLEKIGQEKLRLGRKIEKMEDALADTKMALQSKALVLLTDQAVAARSALPHLKAQGLSASSKVFLGHSQEPANEDQPWWQKAMKMQAVSMTALVLLGLSGGWFISRLQHDVPSVAGPVVASNTLAAHVPDNERPRSVPVASLDVPVLSSNDREEDRPQERTQAVTFNFPEEPELEPEPMERKELASVIKAEKPQEVQPAAGVEMPLTKATVVAERDTGNENKGAEKGALLKEISPDPDLPPVVKKIEEKAFEGNAEAQHDLAAIYTAGHGGVEQDFKKAAFWFQKSAEKGIPNAQYNLGVLYHKGLGVKKNLDKALQLYRAASYQGHPEAQYNLGIAHIEGIGTDYDPVQAASYFEKAATQNVVEAAYNLGLLHENGLLGNVQLEEALFWYDYAAEKGNEEARQAKEQLISRLKISEREVHAILNRVKASLLIIEDQDITKEAAGFMPDSSSQADVTAQVQEQLIRLGLYPGPADGIAGPLTQDAIRSYQSANNMKTNGKADKTLLSHLLSTELISSSGDVGSKE